MTESEDRLTLPRNEEAFQQFMEQIDRRLIEKGIPIPGRQLAAHAEVCWEMGENRFVPKRREPTPGVYNGDDLLLRANAWYDERYGAKQEIYFGPGRALVMIRGDVWEIEYPLVAGEVAFYAGESPDAFAMVYTEEGPKSVSQGRLAGHYTHLRRLDALDFVVSLSPTLANRLHQGELEGILYVFCKHWQPLQTLAFSRRYKYVELARGDLDAAVHHVVSDPPRYGLAKWSAQMAVEKLLKSYVHHAGGKVERHHKLLKHVEQAEKLGGFRIDREPLQEVECTASVRYDEPVSQHRAFRATNNAVELCGGIALALRADFPDLAVGSSP